MIESIATVSLDYRDVRSVEQLILWAEEAFALPAEACGETNIDYFTDRLYHHIGKGSIGYTVVEHHANSRSSALGAVIASPGKGWKTALVSGIAHDYGLHLTFAQAPRESKRRKWWHLW
jgi:hypothetical protein